MRRSSLKRQFWNAIGKYIVGTRRTPDLIQSSDTVVWKF